MFDNKYSRINTLAYKAWLEARRDFFRKHNIPMRRAKKPAADLVARAQENSNE